MKIGVALSGCDIGGVSAYWLLKGLEELGLTVSLVSCSGLAATGALLYSCGLAPEQASHRTGLFLQELRGNDLDTALFALSDSLSPELVKKIRGLVASSANVLDGKTIAFTNDFVLATPTLSTIPLEEGYDLLSACAGAADGLAAYSFRGYRLGDYSRCHGYPVYPLTMQGCDVVITASFLPLCPENVYEALMSRTLQQVCAESSHHIPLCFPSKNQGLEAWDYAEIATSSLKSCKNRLLASLEQREIPA